MSLRDQILQAKDTAVAPVHVPQWGFTCHVRAWSGAERAEFQKWFATAKESGDTGPMLARVAALSLCDEAGQRQFTDDDVSALAGKNGQALDTVAAAALRLNGLYAEAVEDAKKN